MTTPNTDVPSVAPANLILGVAVSLACLAWLLARIDPAEVLETLARFSPGGLVAMAAVYAATFVTRGLRWRCALAPIAEVDRSTSIRVVVVGYAANNLLPGRLGEVVRALVLARRCGLGRAAVLVSVFVERIFDGLIVLAILLAAATTAAGADSVWLDRLAALAACLFVTVTAGVVTGRVARAPLARLARSLVRRVLPGRVDPIMAIIDDGFSALDFIRPNAAFATFLLLGLATWTLEGLVFWIGLAAAGLPAEPAAACLTLAVVNLGILVPSTPGYVGVFQAAAVTALALCGVPEPEALAFAVVVHAVQFFPVTLAGILLLPSVGLGRSEVLVPRKNP